MGEVRDTRAIQQALRGSLESAMRIAAEDLLGKAVKAAPVEEGTLRASGVASVKIEGDQVVGTVTFGTPYAAAQHEGLDFVHPKGGGAKYLEGPLTEMTPRYRDALAKAARRVIENGG